MIQPFTVVFELVQIKWLMYLRVDKLFAGFHTPRIRHYHLKRLKSNIFLIHGLINLPAAVINPWIKTPGSDRPLRMGPIDHLQPLPRSQNLEYRIAYKSDIEIQNMHLNGYL